MFRKRVTCYMNTIKFDLANVLYTFEVYFYLLINPFGKHAFYTVYVHIVLMQNFTLTKM